MTAVRVILSALITFHGFLTFECRKCYIFQRHSFTSDGVLIDCPNARPSCCGVRRNTCDTSCVNYKCETNADCDGLTCCSGNCSNNKNCEAMKTTWVVVSIIVAGLLLTLGLFGTYQWYRKRKALVTRPDTSTATEHQINNRPPFLVSDFDNHGFIAPMAPPSYESVVQNTALEREGHPPVYNLNFQTVINNSTTDEINFNNFEVNISIRQESIFTDFPPSYRDISNAVECTDSLPPSRLPFHSLCSEGTVENTAESRVMPVNHGNEPPPYSLNEESQTSIMAQESNNTTSETAHSAAMSSNTVKVLENHSSFPNHYETEEIEFATDSSNHPETDQSNLDAGHSGTNSSGLN